MWCFLGLYFLLGILEGGRVSYNLGFEIWFARDTLFSITTVAIALCKPYKKLYMNVSDTLLLSHMALMCHILSLSTKNKLFLPFMQILFLIPFAVFTVCILFRIVHGIYRSLLMKSMFGHCLKAESDASTQQELNDNVITYGAISS